MEGPNSDPEVSKTPGLQRTQVTRGGGPENLYGGRGLGRLPTSSSGTRCVPRKHLFVERFLGPFRRPRGCCHHVPVRGHLTILVKMLSQAGTGYSFNTKRSRLREKLTLLHYDPIVKTKVLFVEQKKIRSL
uniref:39S ribosomal protein L33, mitochondrial isoform X2 n=1 Tax=Nyctereutes procyonoides TaxID=34880 RepID=UPI002444ECA8|nr:39S ribosomal protein L33, mitochondrial isoform X2 [Nyctereutes procyonoides]